MYDNKINFTKDVLEKLVPSDKEYEVIDTKVDGLRLRIGIGGSKTFNVKKKINGIQTRYKIGRFPETTIHNARVKAIEAISQLNSGENLSKIRSEKRKELTFKDLWEKYYLEHLIKNTKRPEDNRKMLELHVLRYLEKSKLSLITKSDIKNIHVKISDNLKKKTGHSLKKINYAHADRVITIVSSVFNFGIREEYFSGPNPCHGVKKLKHQSRDRFLNKAELKLFVDAVNLENSVFRDYFMLLLYTGARKTNVLEMEWSDINFELKRWRISDLKTKNSDVNIVVLSEAALEILRRRHILNNKLPFPSKFVFPGVNNNQNLKDPKKAFQRIRDRMNVQDIRIHDLRRTLGSYMAINGISLPIIAKALNHKSQASTSIYARLSQNPVEDALNIAIESMI